MPVALTAGFGGDRQKQAQWLGFVRRMKLRDAPSLPEVVSELCTFLLLPMRAVAGRSHHDLNWVAAKRQWVER